MVVQQMPGIKGNYYVTVEADCAVHKAVTGNDAKRTTGVPRPCAQRAWAIISSAAQNMTMWGSKRHEFNDIDKYNLGSGIVSLSQGERGLLLPIARNDSVRAGQQVFEEDCCLGRFSKA